MSDPEQWQGAAGNEVRNCVALMHRAKEAVEEAQRQLRSAHDELAAAERDFETAKRVYYAGQQDQDRRIQALKVTPQKREWLKALAVHAVFGAGEMRQAAEQVGWDPSPGALRALASDYRKAGYLIGVSHGVIKLNRDRIVAALGPIFDDGNKTEPKGSDGPEDHDAVDLIDAANAEEARQPRADDGLEDDDLPF